MANGFAMSLLAGCLFTGQQAPTQGRLFLTAQHVMACQFGCMRLGRAAIVFFQGLANCTMQRSCPVRWYFIAQCFLHDALTEHVPRRDEVRGRYMLIFSSKFIP